MTGAEKYWLHYWLQDNIIAWARGGVHGPHCGVDNPGGCMREPLDEFLGTMPALTEVQQFWDRLRWFGPAVILAAIAVARPEIRGLTPGGLVIVVTVLLLVPVLVNLVTGRAKAVNAEQVPNRTQLLALAIDAVVILAVVALFCLDDPRSDAFVLLLLPQLQMATTRRLPLMIATAAVSGVAFVGIEVVAAGINDVAAPWSMIGSRLALLVLGAAILGRISRLLARHMSSLRELHRAVAHRALHDPLTGLPNRALFFERVGVALARQERSGVRFAVVFVDLDDLKMVNDTLGHSAGDELIRVTARRLRDELRTTDTPARLGGDEFAALLDEPGNDDDLEKLARRLVDRLGQPISSSALHLRVSVSIGVATSERISSADELLHRADTAMYRAKAEGKGRVVHFDITRPEDVRELGR
jgi:diguanylate cyclase (GGDEF)-like protein